MCKTSIFNIFFPCLYNFTLPKYREDPDLDLVKIFRIRLRLRPNRSGSDRIRIRIRNPGTYQVPIKKIGPQSILLVCVAGEITVPTVPTYLPTVC